jgi:Holliday junction DNA helicase RuvA
MITRVRGTLLERELDRVTVEVGGVGLDISVSMQTLSKLPDIGAEVALYTYLNVREDALQLFGFATADERELFELLLGVSGVGPKVALAIVSGSTPAELRRAIARDDVKRFQAIQGVGLKTAQRVVLELKEKLTVADALAAEANESTLARDALVNLGWSLLDAERALATIDEALPVEEQVREALRAAA